MAEINTPIEQLSFEERALSSPRGFHGWNDDEWDEWMKRDIATGEFDAILREMDDDIKAGRIRDMPRNPERIGGSGIASTSCGGKYH
jgi:hypothetical protein